MKKCRIVEKSQSHTHRQLRHLKTFTYSFHTTQIQNVTTSTQLNSSLLKRGSRMAKRDTVNKNK